MKLKPEIKALWIEALRSGKYKQGVGALKNSEGKFCCLGVLCDIHREQTNSTEQWEPNNSSFGNLTYLRAKFYLPLQVEDWSFEECEDPDNFRILKVFFDNKFCGLGELNDTYRLSFDNIADLIEEQL